jgi:hypothetical protein
MFHKIDSRSQVQYAGSTMVCARPGYNVANSQLPYTNQLPYGNQVGDNLNEYPLRPK